MSQLPPAPPQATHPSRPVRPSTQEVPAAAGPATQVLPRPGAEAPEEGPTPISAPLPPPPGTESTGPVDFVPDPPPAAAPRAGAPTVTRRRRRPGTIAGLVLGVAAVGLLEIGLLLGFGAPHSFWSTVPLWCGFATLAAVVGVLASTSGRSRPGTDRAWRVSAAGLTGLAVFWVLVVLPVGATDRGFVLTAALGCLGVSLWLAPGRTA